MPFNGQPLGTTLTQMPSLDSEEFEQFAAVDPEIARLEKLKSFRESEQGQKLISWVTSEHRKMDNARNRDKRQWQLNLAMYNGQQNATISTGIGQVPAGLFLPPVARGNEKKIINRIKSAIRTELSKLLSQKPGATVVPASSEDEDLFAAIAAEQVFQSLVARRKLHEQFSQSMFWMCITGNGYIKTFWDQATMDTDTKVEGDIVYKDVSPFNIFVPNLRLPQIEDQPYVLHMWTEDCEKAKYMYEAELEGLDLKPTEVSANSILEEASLKISQGADNAPDAVIVYEMWIKPGNCPHLRAGGLVTIVGGHIVSIHDEGIPYNHGEFPFTHFKHIPGGKFYATSIIEELIDLQKDYNEIRTHIAQTRKKMGKAQLIAQKGAISSAKMTNEIGLVIEHRPGTPAPSPLPLVQMPQYIVDEQDRVLSDIEDISGQHQVSKGSAPSGVTAGTAIAYLQERDDNYLLPTYQSIEAGYEKLGRQSLVLVVQYWDTERLVKTVGTDSAFDISMVSGAQIASGTDLRVEAGSALPTSKAAKQALIMDMMKMQFIPPDKGLEMMEIGGAQNLVGNTQLDKRQAQRENIKMKRVEAGQIEAYDGQWKAALASAGMAEMDPETGQPLEAPLLIPVNNFDNHEIHIEIHNNFRKSQSFDLLEDSVKELFNKHVEQHKLAMQTDMLQQMMSQIPSDGTVPGVQAPTEEGAPEEEAPVEEAPIDEGGEY